MPVTTDKPGPYAPASVVLDLIERHRSKGLPAPVNKDVLARAGVPDSLNARTLQALTVLDLLDAAGNPTEIFEGLRRSPEAEFQKRLHDWLTVAYADALKFVDPAGASESSIRDAFRHYNPVGQQTRMVTLFTGLFKAAGSGPEKPKVTSRKGGASSGIFSRQRAAPIKREAVTPPPVVPLDDRDTPAGGGEKIRLQSKTPEQVLLDILDPGRMTEEEQKAVFTLMLFLKKPPLTGQSGDHQR